MIPFDLDSIEKAKKLVNICERYKDDFDIDVIYGRQVIDGTSILGVISLVGHVVSINTSFDNNDRYLEFKETIEHARTE